MKKFETNEEFLVSSDHRRKVQTNLALAIRDRLTHPRVKILNGTIDEVVERTSVDIELSCLKASRSGSYYVYQSLITEFFLHICPYFKTARHSMLFRDMLIGYKMRADDGSIPDSINVAKKVKHHLWPEIFDNKYLTQEQRSSILELRQLEFGIVADLVSKIDKTNELVFVVDKIQLSQTRICYGISSPCWSTPEPNMNVKCMLTGTCEEEKEIKSCMPYEDFLVHFAQNGMLGNVSDPSNPEKKMKLEVVENIRRVWNAELKMTRVYLDVLAGIDENE